MSNYPDYVYRTLTQARDIGQWYCGQPEAVALCFDMLALFPDCQEASDLVYDLFCDEWLIYENRNALQQNIDEWDDRPHQQRRRKALSFRFMSRWGGWRRDFGPGRGGPPDVQPLLDDGYGEVLEGYCLGDTEALDYAWPFFEEALHTTSDPCLALLWIGKLYADLGYFADAADMLTELVERCASQPSRRLLAEVRWWRDNAHRLPWLPPAGDGSRYRRMMQFIDPSAPSDEKLMTEFRQDAQARGITPRRRRPAIDADLAALVADALPAEPAPPPALVDWGFLDTDDGQPGELPDWAKRTARLFRGEIGDDIIQQHRWSRPIPRPATPPRRDPNEPPFDPSEILGMDALKDDDDEDDELA